MCGRSRAANSSGELSSAVTRALGKSVPWRGEWTPSENVAPGGKLPVLCRGHSDGENTSFGIQPMTWGLVPSSSAPGSAPDHFRHFNARSETCSSLSMFRRLANSRRCVVLLSGFYEWKADYLKERQPYYVSLRDAEVMLVAGLYDTWHSDSGPLSTVTLLTKDASSNLEWLHDRMPVILNGQLGALAAWLDCAAYPEPPMSLVLRHREATAGGTSPAPRPCCEARLAWHPVTKRLNKMSTADGLADPAAPVKLTTPKPISFFFGKQPDAALLSPPKCGQYCKDKKNPLPQSSSFSSASSSKADVKHVPCPACTFLNHGRAFHCEVCGTNLFGSLDGCGKAATGKRPSQKPISSFFGGGRKANATGKRSPVGHDTECPVKKAKV